MEDQTQTPAPVVEAAPAQAAVTSATPVVAPAPVGEVAIKWKQEGDEVAPVLEIRAYLDQLKDAGVAVGAMKFEQGADGKLTSSFGVSYDPNSPELAKLEGALQGLKKVGNGVELAETPEQAANRAQRVGEQPEAKKTAQDVSEAFGVKQWDSLSEALSRVPKGSLTAPEQLQQTAGDKRVEQLAQQQGTVKTQVIDKGQSLLDIESAGNPASAFLKNFYAHLNGAAKTRNTLEVDVEKTREELRDKLTKQAGQQQGQDQQVSQGQQTTQQPGVTPLAATVGSAAANLSDKAVNVASTVVEAARSIVNGSNGTTGPASPAVEAPVTSQAPATKFEETDVPQKVLASLGLNVFEMEKSGQLQKLLNGEKTELLTMRVAGAEGKDAVEFKGKMVLQREADGSATLKMELPKEKLVIPNEIGGQPFTPEQRQRLETEGTAGLMRGLKDETGKEFNGYVGVDKTMNKLVILPEDKVYLKQVIAGVTLTPEQNKDLKEGKGVALSQMARSDGGKPYDGVAKVDPVKATIIITPTKQEQQVQKQEAPKQGQQQQAKAAVAAPKAEVKAKVRPKL